MVMHVIVYVRQAIASTTRLNKPLLLLANMSSGVQTNAPVDPVMMKDSLQQDTVQKRQETSGLDKQKDEENGQDKDQLKAQSAADKLYQERIEDEYAKREGGA